MNSLSDVFGGKVLGLNAPMGDFRQSVDVVERKANPGDIRDSGVGVERKMTEFDYKGKENEIERKVFGGMSGGFDYKGKETDIERKVFSNLGNKVDFGSGTNKGPDMFGTGGVSGKKFGFFDNDSDSKVQQALGNINMNTEKIGRVRMKQQKNLSLFGDADKDKTLNVFDCKPFDKKQQAFIHNLLSFGKKEVETPVGKLEQYGLEKKQKSQVAVIDEQEPKLSWKEKFAMAGKGIETGAQKVGTGLENIGYGIGLLKTPEQRMEIERRKTEFAKAKAAERIALAKAGQIVPKQPGPVRGAISAIETGAGRFARETGYGARMTMPTSTTDKIRGLIGLSPYSGAGYQMASVGGPGGGGFYQMTTGKPFVPPPQQQLPYPVPKQTPQAPQPTVQPSAPTQLVISPYSKRPVKYTRGPYKKRVVVQQGGVQP